LRSYYCSRECQNVDWHLQHKYLCFKPLRFALSLFCYTALVIFLFPSLLRHPLKTALILMSWPLTFSSCGTVAGYIAGRARSIGAGDLRGRVLELIVSVSAILCVWLQIGLMTNFFESDDSKCLTGSLATSPTTRDYILRDVLNISSTYLGENCANDAFIFLLSMAFWFVIVLENFVARNAGGRRDRAEAGRREHQRRREGGRRGAARAQAPAGGQQQQQQQQQLQQQQQQQQQQVHEHAE